MNKMAASRDSTAGKAQKKLVKGVKAFEARNPDLGTKLLKAAVELSAYEASTVKLAVTVLNDNGAQKIAFDILEAYLASGGTDAGIYEIMAKMALDNKSPEIAQKLLLILIKIEPDAPRHYVNYCDCLVQLDQAEEAVSLLQQVIPKFPEYAALWNQLGSILAIHLNQLEQGLEFCMEAHRLDPQNIETVNNIATLKAFDSDAEVWFKKAIDVDPEHPSPHVGYALHLLQNGQFQEGYGHYEHRLSPNQGGTTSVIYKHNRPVWCGEPLDGKTIFVMAEQGLGDELLFSRMFEKLCHQAEAVIISCDPRLVTIFSRTFPKAEVVSYEDESAGASRLRRFPDIENRLIGKSGEIDFVVPAGSLMQYFWPDNEHIDVIEGQFLKPAPDLVNQMAARINRGDGRLKIGVSWKSGNAKGLRSTGYFSHKYFNKFKFVENADFFNLQYDVTESEKINFDWDLNHITNFDDIDFRNDLDMSLALISSLDVVIGPGTATQMMALLSGIKTYYVVSSGLPWWNFGHNAEEGPALAPHCTWFSLQDRWKARDRLMDELSHMSADGSRG